MQSMIFFMKNNDEPQTTIQEYMNKTAQARYIFIRENCDRTVGEILQEYPRLLSPGMVCRF